MDATIRSVEPFPVSCTLPRPVGDGQALQPVRQTLFVRVTSQSGLVGWGEGGGAVPGADLVRRQLGAAVVGMDARDTDAIHARLSRARAARGTLGAIDMALWDLKGKLLGMPLCQLLIGAPRVHSDGTFAVPTAPGLGVEVDREVLAEFALDA